MERAGWVLLIQNRYPDAGYGPFFDSMGAYRVLLGAADPEEISRLIRDEIGPLLQPASPSLQPTGHASGELLRTLRIFLDENLSASATAKRLGLSRQALYQRIARIEEILGTNLQDPERRLSLALALRAHEIEDLKKGNFTASSLPKSIVSEGSGDGTLAPRRLDR
jgi:DNA-binding PucR family transcriptional regulator